MLGRVLKKCLLILLVVVVYQNWGKIERVLNPSGVVSEQTRASARVVLYSTEWCGYCKATRRFLDQAEQEGVVLPVCDDIPKSFLVCDHPYHRQIVYISQLNTQTLVKRAEKK